MMEVLSHELCFSRCRRFLSYWVYVTLFCPPRQPITLQPNPSVKCYLTPLRNSQALQLPFSLLDILFSPLSLSIYVSLSLSVSLYISLSLSLSLNKDQCSLGGGEMNQQLIALAALPENQGSIPSTHTTAPNCL